MYLWLVMYNYDFNIKLINHYKTLRGFSILYIVHKHSWGCYGLENEIMKQDELNEIEKMTI